MRLAPEENAAHDIAKFLASLPWTLREGVTIDRPSGTTL
jgi:hypothetical protein